MQQVVKAVDEQGQQGSKEHLQFTDLHGQIHSDMSKISTDYS